MPDGPASSSDAELGVLERPAGRIALALATAVAVVASVIATNPVSAHDVVETSPLAAAQAQTSGETDSALSAAVGDDGSQLAETEGATSTFSTENRAQAEQAAEATSAETDANDADTAAPMAGSADDATDDGSENSESAPGDSPEADTEAVDAAGEVADDGAPASEDETEADDTATADEDTGTAEDTAAAAEDTAAAAEDTAAAAEDTATADEDAAAAEDTETAPDAAETTDQEPVDDAAGDATDSAEPEVDADEPAAPATFDEDGNREIVFPVVGPVNYSDTWGACRGSGCSRRHRGVDIFGHKLAPLVAAADGVISRDRRSATGISGNTVIISGDDGWRYLYIHLNNDSPGSDDGSNPQAWIVPSRLRVGDRVKAGDVIGYLGDSGNAETTPAHVHFEIHEPGTGAINPTPAVESADRAGRVISVASLSSSPAGRAEHAPTVSAWYRALLKREPTDIELFAWTDRMDIGFATQDDLIADLTMSKPRRDPAGNVVRAFAVTLDRLPTLNELRQWEAAIRNGTDLAAITRTLTESEAFRGRHGDLSDAEFVSVIYRNAVGVEPSEKRLADWLELFADGSPRSTLATYWADSYSVKNSTWHGLEVVQSFRAGLDRMPDDAEYDQWVAHLDRGGLIPDVVDGIRTGG